VVVFTQSYSPTFGLCSKIVIAYFHLYGWHQLSSLPSGEHKEEEPQGQVEKSSGSMLLVSSLLWLTLLAKHLYNYSSCKMARTQGSTGSTLSSGTLCFLRLPRKKCHWRLPCSQVTWDYKLML
jgi:hypothetical protein